jgi:hypothetical protein
MRIPRLLPALLILLSIARAQEIQLHYDFGEDRDYLTTTIEMFKPDAWGTTFFFVDFNYDGNDVEGVSESYFEFARAFYTDDLPVGLHLEYNGGQGRFNTPEGENAYPINDAWLVGPEMTWNAEDYSKGVTLQLLYKNIRGKNDDSFQITFVWYSHLMDKAFTFRGFADFWKEDNDFNFDGKQDADYTFLSEPQLWYNVTEKFAIGSEVEFGYNFAGVDGWKVCPTAAVKYVF